jgi:hypothetical protein
MDDWSLALLSCKLGMIGVNTGGVIKQQGAPSDYAYILLGGAAKVSSLTLASFWSNMPPRATLRCERNANFQEFSQHFDARVVHFTP